MKPKAWALITHDRQDTRNTDMVTLWCCREAAIAAMATDEEVQRTGDNSWESEFEMVSLEELEIN